MDDDTINDILKAIGAKPEGKYFALPSKQMKALADAGFIEGNASVTNPRNKNQIAFRLTDAGKARLPGTKKTATKTATKAAKKAAKKAPAKRAASDSAEAPSPAPATPSSFVLGEIDIPPVMRNSAGSKYPFAQLEPGIAFFVPEGGDVRDPSKSFGSMVTAANKKYRNPTDFRKFTVRTMVLDQKSAKVFGHPVGTKGVAVFRLKAADEAREKAKAFPRAK